MRGTFLAHKAVQSDINESERACYFCRGVRLQQVKGFMPSERQKHRFNTSCRHTHVGISYPSDITVICLALRPFHPEAVQFYMHWAVVLKGTDIPAYPENFVHPHSSRTEDKSC